MQDFLGKKILLGVCGGIAAYKVPYLVRELTQLGARVRVVLTKHAQQFVTPWTLQALGAEAVRSTLFDAEAERAMGHIELARWADYLLIAPASANCLAKMAHGMADDLLSTLYLVCEAPVIVCPAMNQSMWAHPATQSNYEHLAQRKVIFCGPLEGSQACGEYGLGRFAETHDIIDALRLFEIHQILKGQSVLITAGPTQEAIDPVRYLSNRSSGKMGYALAKAAQMAGAQVTLVSGPVALQPPWGVICHPVKSAAQMHEKVMACLQEGMIFIGAAAVSDYRCERPEMHKIKKETQQDTLTLSLVQNRDILAEVAASELSPYVIGFAAETEQVVANAQKKLKKKNVDMMIANIVGAEQGFEQEQNQVTLITENEQIDLPMNHKTRLAGKIIAILTTKLQNSQLKIADRDRAKYN